MGRVELSCVRVRGFWCPAWDSPGAEPKPMGAGKCGGTVDRAVAGLFDLTNP